MSQIATYSDVVLISGVTILGTYDPNKCVKYSDILPNNREPFWTGENSVYNVTRQNLVNISGADPLLTEDWISGVVNEGDYMSSLRYVPNHSLTISGEPAITDVFWFRETGNKTYEAGLLPSICYKVAGEYTYADFSYISDALILNQPEEATGYLEGIMSSVWVVLPFQYCTVTVLDTWDGSMDSNWWVNGYAFKPLLQINLL